MFLFLIFAIVCAASVFASLLFYSRATLMLAPPAALCALIAWLDMAPLLLFGIFLALVALAYLLYYLLIVRKGGENELSAIGVIGARCTVTEEIDNVAGSGLALCKKRSFAARALDEDEIIQVGDTVTVVAVEGVRLVCKKA